MNNFENEAKMQQLTAQRSSGKKKMILGIVFIGVGVFLWMVRFALNMVIPYHDYAIYYAIDIIRIVMLLLSAAFITIGTPFLIIGIVRMSKTNSQIAVLRAEDNRSMANAQAQKQPQMNYQQQPQQQYAQSAANQNNEQQASSQQTSSQQNAEAEKSTGFIDIDFEKYEPLEAGISYNANKNYQFHRAEGFVGSKPQTFVNRTFPKCPLCCTADPYWTIAQHNQMSWKGNLYLFKCSKCDGIISMSMPDVTTLADGGSGVAANPSVGLTNLMVKASSGKKAGAVYGVIESVGNSGVTRQCEGKEFKLEDFQQMFLRM